MNIFSWYVLVVEKQWSMQNSTFQTLRVVLSFYKLYYVHSADVKCGFACGHNTFDTHNDAAYKIALKLESYVNIDVNRPLKCTEKNTLQLC